MSQSTRSVSSRSLTRNIVAAIVVSATLAAAPAPASAGVLDVVKRQVSSIYSQVRSIRSQLAEMIAAMNETKGAFRSGGARQMLDSVTSTLAFLQESRAQYDEFAGPDNCGIGSPCDNYRQRLHAVINDVVALPRELPFVDGAPRVLDRFDKVRNLIDKSPVFVLYASEQVVGDSLEKALELTGTIREVAIDLPDVPSARDARSMDRRSFADVCETVPGNPHIALLDVLLDNFSGLFTDLGGFTQDNITFGVTAVGGGTVSIKNPAKQTFQSIAFVLKNWQRQLKMRVAVVTSLCHLAGHDVSS